MFDSGEEAELQPKIKIKDSDERVISGTEGLAKFLGCGKSMAFSIIKNGVLIENGIQYKVGNTWKFNAERLRRFLHQPHIFYKTSAVSVKKWVDLRVMWTKMVGDSDKSGW